MSAQHQHHTPATKLLARFCESCPVCRRARAKQGGLCYQFVRRIERGLCPAGRAYEKVHARKAHEPVPGPDLSARSQRR